MFIRKRLAPVMLLILILFATACSDPGKTPISTRTPDPVSPIGSAVPVNGKTATPVPFTPAESEFSISASCTAVYDTAQNRYLYLPQSGDTRLYPASLTKLFTAYTVLQILDPDTVVTAGDELRHVGENASIAYIAKGHRLTVSMLIEGMLLPSGNDAAYVLAAAAGRKLCGEKASVSTDEALSAFVTEMNRQAAINGLSGTHFTSPDGYHDDDHYTTVNDLMRMAKLALREDLIAHYASLREDSVWFESGESITWINTNLLLDPASPYYRESACGLKTGHTNQSGYAQLSAFRSGSSYILILVSGCKTPEQRIQDTVTLYDALS